MCPKPQQLKSTDGIHTLEFYPVYQRTSGLQMGSIQLTTEPIIRHFYSSVQYWVCKKSHQNKTIRVVKIFFGSTTEINHLLQVITARSYVVRTLRSV